MHALTRWLCFFGTAALLAGCQTAAQVPDKSEPEKKLTEQLNDIQAPRASPNTTQESVCDSFDRSILQWYPLNFKNLELEGFDDGPELEVSQAQLPETLSSRYSTLAEVCTGLFTVLTHEGESRLIDLTTEEWSVLPALEPAGSLADPADPGIEGGTLFWGFRYSLRVHDDLYLSDGVIDTDEQCVYVAVHRVNIGALLTASSPSTEVIYRSQPCVGYTDGYRASAPLRTHLGGALAYSSEQNEVYVSIGDLHLGSSTIAQAEAIGIENVQRDYSLLTDSNNAVSAVVAIADPKGGAIPRIFSKGLRNSLGMTVSEDNRLWLTDHGPQGGDELNLVIDGADYGWPLTSEGQPYDRSSYPEDPELLPAPWLDIFQAPIGSVTAPTLSWTPAVAPTSIVQMPPTDDAWAGDLMMGTLREESLIWIGLEDNDVDERDRLYLGQRVRDLVATESGDLVLITDSPNLIHVEAE